ncbi:MAG: DUF3857 domain-containing protein [Flavobacterium sp.]|nr:DUF3857 domain-containing protein [Flavobacterium sp.]
MKKILFSLIVLLVFKASAQNLEFGKVSKQELLESTHKLDSSAVAAFLYKKAKTTYKYTLTNGFSMVTEFSIRIKIYKKEGLKWADFEIPYYVGYEKLADENVTILNANTYNIENGKIIKEKVLGESKFQESTNEFWKTKKITFPNVKEGSIIELKYRYKSENLSELPLFQYQYKIPVNFAQFITEIPPFFLYNVVQLGFVKVSHEDKIEPITVRYDNEHGQAEYLNYQQVKTKYEAVDVPKLIEEDYVRNMNNYYSKIAHELKTVQFPNQPPKQLASTWESVAKSIFEADEFGGELNKSDYFFKDLKRIVKSTDSTEVRLKVIFDYVKNKMNWNGNLGFFTKSGVVSAYNENSGNVAEINLMLIAMLKIVGIEANPVLLSTKTNGVTLFPNKSKFDYVIASAEVDGKRYLLDATCKNCSINNLPIRDLNDKGRLISKDGITSEIDLVSDNNSVNQMTMSFKIDSAGEVIGKVVNAYFDFEALKFRENISGASQENLIDNFEKKYSGFEVENYELVNDKLVDQPVYEKYTISNKNFGEILGDRIFFSPMLCFGLVQNPFKQNNRQFPINFLYPTRGKYLININIPKGYKIETLPESISIGIKQKQASFDFLISSNAEQITINSNLDVNATIIPAEDYDYLKNLFKLIIEKQTEKIVLKKI